MADTVASQIIVDGSRNIVMKFTSISDGTGETDVKKVDISTLAGLPTSVKINKVEYFTHGIGVKIDWDATANVQAFRIPQDESGSVDLAKYGGIVNNSAAGKTGDILFSTTEVPLAGDGYTVILSMVKGFG